MSSMSLILWGVSPWLAVVEIAALRWAVLLNRMILLIRQDKADPLHEVWKLADSE